MILTIVKKELNTYFRSPIAYMIAGLFTFIIGWIFFNQLVYFTEHVQKIPVHMRSHYDFSNEVVIKMFGNMNFLLLFFVPILTMKSFSQEYKDETINLFFTGPVSDYELIIGKYISYLLMGSFVISTTLVFPFFLGNLDLSDTIFIFSGFLGIFLNLCCYCALGCLASSLTKNQVIAALCGFVFVFFSWLIAMLAQSTTHFMATEILRFLSINHHFQNFAKGKIAISDISFYISFLSIVFLLIKKRIDVRNWG